MELHSERDGVNHDEYEDGVLEGLRRNEPPYLVLYPVLGNVAPDRLSLQCKLYTVTLVLVQLAILVLLLALVLECDDDEAYEDVNHKEGNDDDIDNVIGGHDRTEVVYWSVVLGVRIYRNIQQPWPTLKRRYREKCQHGLGHVVEMEFICRPHP